MRSKIVDGITLINTFYPWIIITFVLNGKIDSLVAEINRVCAKKWQPSFRVLACE